MVDAHRVVGRNRSVQERISLGRVFIAAQVLLDDLVALPPGKQIALEGGEVGAAIDPLDSGQCVGHVCRTPAISRALLQRKQ
ncbi:MAG: hypothetical protein K0Q71_1330 [Thermomicrobiales bacterium]|nr:hypothetical protein [Thermomicrobiales bacterium]